MLMVFAVLAGLSWAVLGLSYKLADHARCRPPAFTFVFSFVAGILVLGKSFFEQSTWADARLWWLGCAMGVLLYVAIWATVRAYALGSAAITWTIVSLSLLVPILLAHFVYNEQLYWIDIVILLLFALMLLAFARGTMTASEETHPRHAFAFLLALLTVFVVNGTFMFSYKVKDVLFSNTNSSSLGAIMYLSTALIAFIALCLRERHARVLMHEWRIGALAGISSSAGFLFFLAAASLNSMVLFPLGQGTSLLCGVIVTAALFREALNAYKSVGLVLGIIVFMLAGFRAPITTHFAPRSSFPAKEGGVIGGVVKVDAQTHSTSSPSLAKTGAGGR